MAPLSVDSSISFLLRLTTELAALVASELLVRCIWPQEAHARRERPARPLLFQLGILLASSVLLSLALLGGVTYLLLLSCVYLSFRVAALYRHGQRDNQYLSQPLQVADFDDSDTEEALTDRFPVACSSNQPQPVIPQASNHVASHPTPHSQSALHQRLSEDKPQSTTVLHTSSSRNPLNMRPADGIQLWSRPRPIFSPSVAHTTGVPLARPSVGLRDGGSRQTRLTSSGSSRLQRSAMTPFSSSPSFPLSPPLSTSSPFQPRPPASTAPPGLINAGNRCFVNTVLQCLAWSPGLNEALSSVPATTEDTQQTALVSDLLDLFGKCRTMPDGVSAFNSIDPSAILVSLSALAPHLVVSPASRGWQPQQDAAELLLSLVNYLRATLAPGAGLTRSVSTASAGALRERKEQLLSELEKAKSVDVRSLYEPLEALAETDWQLCTEGSSPVVDSLLLGQLMEARECRRCQQLSFNTEYFTILHLPVPASSPAHGPASSRVQLGDCLRTIGETEPLEEGNMLCCSSCRQLQGGGEVTFAPGARLGLLSRLPRLLVVQLMRYSYSSRRKTTSKNTVDVGVPLSLDMHPFTMEARLNPQTGRERWYRLFALCAHSGAQTTSHGHYVCYCRASDGRWYYYNDETVCAVNVEAELRGSFVSQNAYLLFYTNRE